MFDENFIVIKRRFVSVHPAGVLKFFSLNV